MVKYEFVPFKDLIVIRNRQVTDFGGIVLMEQDTKHEQFAEVVSKGKDVSEDINVGDLIVIAEGMTNTYDLPNGETVKTIAERYVRGKIEMEG